MLGLAVVAISALCAAGDEELSNFAWADRAFSEEVATLPFSFVYGGQPSSALLPAWERRAEVGTADGGQRRILTLTDPVTKLEVRAVATVFGDTPGVDWTVYFTNNGAADTPIIE
ncbi:MAG: hypothetical protein RBU21_18970 [FCB group bacterium]|jgi:hypothetical protein|nr:hypothetical protein [FCB group bacterium]